MRLPHPRRLALLRNRVIRVQTITDFEARLAELETGIPEHVRQAPDLHRFLDGLEGDVAALLASRAGRPDDCAGGD